MTAHELLGSIPDVDVAPTDAIRAGIDDSVRYLESDAAIDSLAADAYWPKWHGPWWHAVALWELGEAKRIPKRAIDALIAAIDRTRIHVFPTRPEDLPPDVDHARDYTCHCAVGTMDQVLAACGVDVAHAVPWFEGWFARYQMADGGLNCDDSAYAVTGECPSSMVGTVAPFEATLRRRGDREADAAIERGAAFLIGRELRLGSSTVHNAAEREAASQWLQPTFPRFYFYDVLRGLHALVRWNGDIPERAIERVVEHLAHTFPDGIVRVQRRAFTAHGTWMRESDGRWRRHPVAPTFPLLDAISVVGAPSHVLTAEWRTIRDALRNRMR